MAASGRKWPRDGDSCTVLAPVSPPPLLVTIYKALLQRRVAPALAPWYRVVAASAAIVLLLLLIFLVVLLLLLLCLLVWLRLLLLLTAAAPVFTTTAAAPTPSWLFQSSSPQLVSSLTVTFTSPERDAQEEEEEVVGRPVVVPKDLLRKARRAVWQSLGQARRTGYSNCVLCWNWNVSRNYKKVCHSLL